MSNNNYITIRMSCMRDIKNFCDKYKFDFPSFEIIPVNCNYFSRIIWCSENIYTSPLFSDEDSCIINCAMYLDQWLKSEKNFLKIIIYHSGKNKNYQEDIPMV